MKNLLLTVALFGLSFASTAQTVVPGVTVSGEGVVYVKPDQVIVNVAVEHSGDYVEKVKQQTEKDVDAVIDFLKKQGIPSKNIKTEYIRLNQQYDYPTKTYNYSSTQGISIKIEQIENYGTILTGLMNAGVNRINGVQFKSSEAEKYEAQARKKAILNAKTKAEDYAGALDQKIGKATVISDVENSYRPVYTTMEFKAMDSAAGSANQDVIAPGQLAITAKVTVTFNLY